MKIFVNGKLYRDRYGRFTNFKIKVIRFVKKVILVSFICGLIAGAYGIGKASSTATYVNAQTLQVDNLSSKIEQLKKEAVNGIMSCESQGYTEDDGIIIFDSNNKASIGRWQWQKSSIIYYYKTLYSQDITPKEAVLIALDDEKAGKLAYDVIFKDSKGWRNWYNCGVKTKIQTQLELIKKLES